MRNEKGQEGNYPAASSNLHGYNNLDKSLVTFVTIIYREDLKAPYGWGSRDPSV